MWDYGHFSKLFKLERNILLKSWIIPRFLYLWTHLEFQQSHLIPVSLSSYSSFVFSASSCLLWLKWQGNHKTRADPLLSINVQWAPYPQAPSYLCPIPHHQGPEIRKIPFQRKPAKNISFKLTVNEKCCLHISKGCQAIKPQATGAVPTTKMVHPEGTQDGKESDQFSSVLQPVQLYAAPWIAAHQASLSITNSRSSLRLRYIESVMPSSQLILCRPLLLLPSIPPSIRVFSNESVLRIRLPKYWSFSFSIIPSKEHPGLISFRMDWLDLLAVQESSPTPQFKSINSSVLSFLHSPTLTSINDYWKKT